MQTAKAVWNITVKVAAWLLIAFAVFMMIFTVVTVTTVDKNERTLFGFRFYIVTSDSMSPSENNKDMKVHFSAGDIVIAKTVRDNAALQPGEIISFISTDEENYLETVTHMIRSVEYDEEGKVTGYVTYGTNTGDDDDTPAAVENVLGVYVGKLAGVGNFFAFVKSNVGYVLCILLPFLLLILYNGINVLRLFRQYKGEQMAAVQAERDQINAERAENQRMMQELLALKAQLEQAGATVPPRTDPIAGQSPEETESAD